MSVRRVLDHQQTMALCNRVDRIHVGGQTSEVDGDDRAGLLGHRRLDLRRIKIVGRWIDIHEHRDRPDLETGSRCRHEGIRGNDHLIANVKSGGDQGHFERRGPTGDGEAEIAVVVAGKLLLELAGLRTPTESPPLATADDLRHRLDVSIVDDRPRREGRRPEPGTTVDCEFRHLILRAVCRPGQGSNWLTGPGPEAIVTPEPIVVLLA